MFDAIAWDFDGTLVDSRSMAFAITEEIAALFGIKAGIASMMEYRLTFSQIETVYALETANAETLRALHRLLMKTRVASVPVFDPVLALVNSIKIESVVITSGLRATVMERIGEQLNNTHAVLGHETGVKEYNLARWSEGRQCVYVTDNIRDIKHCRDCGVSAIAVGWGFDAKQDLIQAGPDWFVSDTVELKSLLETLTLIT